MSELTKRIARWTVKSDPAKVKAILDELRSSMLTNAQTAFQQLVLMEAQTRQVLDGEGVPLIQYPFYLNFARELWSLQRRGFSGDSLAREVQVLIAKWTNRGLAAPILEKLRTQVFNVAPFGP